MDDRIRASDADRDRVTARLREHFAEGRLTQDELEERINDALSAKTLGDLRAVMTDLPEPGVTTVAAGPKPWQPAGPGSYPVGRYRRRGPRLFPLVLIGLFVALAVSGHGAAAAAGTLAVISVLASIAFFGFLAFAVLRLFSRARYDQYHQQFRGGHRHHHHHRGFGLDDQWPRY